MFCDQRAALIAIFGRCGYKESEIPPVLLRLADFEVENKVELQGDYVDDFNLWPDPHNPVPFYFGAKADPEVIQFARTGNGSVFALWSYDGRPPDEAPV